MHEGTLKNLHAINERSVVPLIVDKNLTLVITLKNSMERRMSDEQIC